MPTPIQATKPPSHHSGKATTPDHTRVGSRLSRCGAALALFLAAIAANLGLLTPASAQTANNLVFLTTTETSSSLNITNSAKAAFQAEATAQGLNFIDGTGALSGTVPMPAIDDTTKVLVLVTYAKPITVNLDQIGAAMLNDPRLTVLLFIDNTPPNPGLFLPLLQATVPGWGLTQEPTTSLSPTAVLNTVSSTYANSPSFAGLPSITGNFYAPYNNVPTNNALYVDSTVTPTTPTTGNVYTIVIPQAESNNGQGACVFSTFDAGEFSGAAQSNAIAQAFVTAALDPNGPCAIQPTLTITKTADTTAALTPGGTVQYTITVTNTSVAADASAVQVSDPLPAGIASYTWACSGAACPNPNGSTPLNNETIATLPAGQSVTYLITATVAAAPPAVVTNTVSLTGTGFVCVDATGASQPCSAQANNPSDADMQGIAPASVSATVGNPVTVPFTCTNNGPDGAVNATCAVTGAPGGVTPVCTPAAPVAWLAVGSSIHCTVTFTPTSTNTVTLTVTAGTDSQDADPTNDAQSVDITPVAAQSAGLPAAPVPTLTDIVLIVLTLMLGVTAVAVHRRGR